MAHRKEAEAEAFMSLADLEPDAADKDVAYEEEEEEEEADARHRTYEVHTRRGEEDEEDIRRMQKELDRELEELEEEEEEEDRPLVSGNSTHFLQTHVHARPATHPPPASPAVANATSLAVTADAFATEDEDEDEEEEEGRRRRNDEEEEDGEVRDEEGESGSECRDGKETEDVSVKEESLEPSGGGGGESSARSGRRRANSNASTATRSMFDKASRSTSRFAPPMSTPSAFRLCWLWFCRKQEAYRQLKALKRSTQEGRLVEGSWDSEYWVLDPIGTVRYGYNFYIFFVITFVIWEVLLRVFFQAWASTPFVVVNVFLDLALIGDIYINFHTGFEEKGGVTVLDKKKIQKHYIKTYFVYDLLASIPVDILAVIPSVGYNPVLRLNKLFRIRRISWFFHEWIENTNMNRSLVRIIAFLYYFVLLVHWFACLFFFVCYVEGSKSVTFSGFSELLSMNLYQQYIRSAFTSIIIFVGYGGYGIPLTNYELVYSLFIVITGASLFGPAIGVVQSLQHSLDSANEFFRQKIDDVNDYMHYRKLPEHIQNSVRAFYKHMWKTRQGSNVLDDLPLYLKFEILSHLNRGIVMKVPLFQGCGEDFIDTISSVLRPLLFMKGYYIMRKGDLGKEMYFINQGKVEVVSEDGQTVFATLGEGLFFGEIALVFSEKRTASIRAATTCELFILTKDDFENVLDQYPDYEEQIRSVAEERRRKAQNAQKK